MIVRRFPAKTAVYLSCGHMDMRKSINGLAAVVQGAFELDPFQGALFVFCNKDKNKIKVLHWDKDGFALYYKRRERGRFCWPALSEVFFARTFCKKLQVKNTECCTLHFP